MRIHLGHHFYGAGNLGDDFMLAGFLSAMRTLAPSATFTCCVPFALDPLRQRFPSITWLPCDEPTRTGCVAACDVWLGLGGSPFQHSLSRWFIDHLLSEAALCQRSGKPMFFLGIGIQTATELANPDVRHICSHASAIWTRDPASAERLATVASTLPVACAADLAHVFFRETPPPPPHPGRLTLVANFDYGAWPGQAALLRAVQLPSPSFAPSEYVWLSQESRELPGAERALHAALPPNERSRWQLIVPDEPASSAAPFPLLSAPSLAIGPSTTSDTSPDAIPDGTLKSVFARWPSGEWLVTARFHAALAGAWSGSKIVILSTNEKLRAAARELACPVLAPDADEATALAALQSASAPSLSSALPASLFPAPLPHAFPATSSPGRPPVAPSLLAAADQAYAACAAFVRAAQSSLPRSLLTSAVAPAQPTP